MMTSVSDATLHARRDEWIASLGHLADQLEQWCNELQWPAQRHWTELQEPLLGIYRVPTLRVKMPSQSVLYFTPVALFAGGASSGRVDLESWPSLNRVRLSLGSNGQWEVWTDSNVRLREPWTRDVFARIAEELGLAA